MVNQDVQVGDIVAILYGCSVPVTLHRDETGSTLTLMGECYVDGMMDGEAMQWKQEHMISDELFEIR